jgi:hypothetical protein
MLYPVSAEHSTKPVSTKWFFFQQILKCFRAGLGMGKSLTSCLISSWRCLRTTVRPSVIHSGRSFFFVTTMRPSGSILSLRCTTSVLPRYCPDGRLSTLLPFLHDACGLAGHRCRRHSFPTQRWLWTSKSDRNPQFHRSRCENRRMAMARARTIYSPA